MYVDGNIHGNEIQAAEACLYLIWYLAENYGRLDKVTELVDERAFYVVPTVNPDGRACWFNGPNTTQQLAERQGARSTTTATGWSTRTATTTSTATARSPRCAGRAPTAATSSRREDPRLLVPIRPGEEVAASYELLGAEGIDNDGDGRINEDPPGGYDMNRNWPADWQPGHVQGGAGPYPLCWPETRAIGRLHPRPPEHRRASRRSTTPPG